MELMKKSREGEFLKMGNLTDKLSAEAKRIIAKSISG